jgi:hypothetical protein
VTLPATQPPRCLSARMAVRPARASAVRRCVVPALNLNCAAPATRAQVYCDSMERMLGKRPDGRAEPGARHAPALPARPRFLLRSRPRARRPVRFGRRGAHGQAGRGARAASEGTPLLALVNCVSGPQPRSRAGSAAAGDKLESSFDDF